jgi:threonine/homoserine/homoserine lactone efflux protein
MKVSGHATASRRSEAEPGMGVAVSSTNGGSGGRFEGDAVTKGFEFADMVALLTFWVGTGVVVAGAEVVELGALVAKQVPDDDPDGTA